MFEIIILVLTLLVIVLIIVSYFDVDPKVKKAEEDLEQATNEMLMSYTDTKVAEIVSSNSEQWVNIAAIARDQTIALKFLIDFLSQTILIDNEDYQEVWNRLRKEMGMFTPEEKESNLH